MSENNPPDGGIPYATAHTGRDLGGLLPLVCGFALLVLGLLTMLVTLIASSAMSGPGYRSEEMFLAIALPVGLVGFGCVVCGIIIVFRALRRYA